MIIDIPDMKITYETRDELIAALRAKGYSQERIARELRHEDAHMKKALELGYKPRYCFGIFEDVGCIKTTRAGVQLDEPASDEDLVAILSAPEELSESDKAHLQELRRKQEAQK